MSSENDVYRWIADSIVYRWFGLLIFCLGLVGGSLSLLVFRQKSLRNKSCSIYFFFLALSDLLCMVCWFVHFVLPTYNVQLHTLSNVSCKIFVFSLYFAFDSANYILSICSLDRAITVLFPVKSRRFCHRRMAHSITVVLVVVLTLINSHFFYGFTVIQMKSQRDDSPLLLCHIRNDSSSYKKLFSVYDSYVDAIKTNLIPFVVMSLCNSIIIVRVCRSKRTMIDQGEREKTEKCSSRRTIVVRRRTNKSKRKQEKDRQLTLMLLGSSIAFLVLTLPTEINDIIRSHSSQSLVDEKTYLLSSILLSLAHLNYAVHFYIYTLTGEVFRRELVKLWPIRLICSSSSGNVSRSIGEARTIKSRLSDRPTSNQIGRVRVSSTSLRRESLSEKKFNVEEQID